MADGQTAPPRPGEEAPDFTLHDTGWKPVRLQECRGHTVILAFFPAAFSGVCTAELGTLRQNLSALRELDAHVIGISVDLPYTLKRFKLEEQLTFALLSDFDRAVIRDYGIMDADFNGFRSGVARRSVFIIDGDGKIAWSWVCENQGQQPDYAEVLAAVESLTRETAQSPAM
jgi:glutaredoxin-dependent peroxiredoxin